MFKYFRSRHANNLTTQLDGVLMYSGAEYRIPFGTSVIVESDTSLMCPYNHYIRVKQTILQEEKNIMSWFIFENKTGKDQFILLKTKITNTIKPEYTLNVDKSIVISKLEPIGIFQVLPCASMDGIVRVLNQNEFFEEQKINEKLSTQLQPQKPQNNCVVIELGLNYSEGMSTDTINNCYQNMNTINPPLNVPENIFNRNLNNIPGHYVWD